MMGWAQLADPLTEGVLGNFDGARRLAPLSGHKQHHGPGRKSRESKKHRVIGIRELGKERLLGDNRGLAALDGGPLRLCRIYRLAHTSWSGALAWSTDAFVAAFQAIARGLAPIFAIENLAMAAGLLRAPA